MEAVRIVSFGLKGFQEPPQPVLTAMESCLIALGQLTSGFGSIQLNLVDSNPYSPAMRPKLSKRAKRRGKLLAKVWKALYKYHLRQERSFDRGQRGLGWRPVPVSNDGRC